MKRIAVFGNAGGGKSTLARALAEITGAPLHVVDEMQFRPGGEEVPREAFLATHAALLGRDAWVIDGFGGHDTIWARLEVADTLVHVDLALAQHTWWVTKRFAKGLFGTPKGWPEGSPLIASTMSSYRVLRPCHVHLTPKYRAVVAQAAASKRVFHLRSPRAIRECIETVRNEIR